MAREVRAGVHGRARRHIVAMGGIFAERFHGPGSSRLIPQDRFLALLVRNDAVTEVELCDAIDAYRRCPRDYAWILSLRHTILDRADQVFFVRHQRFPTKSRDFVVNGRYHQICQALQYDRACFDEELKQLAWGLEGDPRIVKAPPEVLATPRKEMVGKGSALAFALILLVSLGSAIAFAVLIVHLRVPDLPPAVLAVAICWMVFLACGLIVTRPRRVETVAVHHVCSECRSELASVQPIRHCPGCGVSFEPPSAQERPRPKRTHPQPPAVP